MTGRATFLCTLLISAITATYVYADWQGTRWGQSLEELRASGMQLEPVVGAAIEDRSLPAYGKPLLSGPEKLSADYQPQSDDNSIIEEADRIFDLIVETHGAWTYTITPDIEYFNFFADNFAFFRSHSTQQDDGIYDYRLPTSGYLHVKDFRFVVDANQNPKLVVVQSAFL